jgi:hypothetical protein
MHILAELDTQRKALLKKGEEVPSHMVKPSFEELMAGRVQPSPDETPKEKEKRISAFWFMVEFLPPKVRGAKGWEADMCSIPLQQTNFTASDETTTKLALENMWRQWDMFQDYVVRFSKKLVISAILWGESWNSYSSLKFCPSYCSLVWVYLQQCCEYTHAI